MVKDKAAALERAKKATWVVKGKKQNRGPSSCSVLPPGWIQGDWIRYLLRQEDLEELMESGLITKGAARLQEGETEPQPRSGECVLPMSTAVSQFLRTLFPGFLEFLRGQTPSFFSQHHQISCRVRVHVREFLGVSTALGSFQAHLHHSFPIGKKGEVE